MKEEFDGQKRKVQRAQWKANFAFVIVSGTGREVIRAYVRTHKSQSG